MQPGERKAVVYIAMESNNMSRRESAQSKLGAVVVADSAPTLAPSLASCVGWRARSGQSAWMGMGYPRSIFQFSNISPTPASPKQYYCTPIRPGDPQWLDGRSNVVDVDVVFIVVVAVAVLDVAKFTANTAIFRRRRRRTPAIRFSLNRWRENGSFVGREMSDRATVPLAEKRVDD